MRVEKASWCSLVVGLALVLASAGTAVAGPVTINFETLPSGVIPENGTLIGSSYAPWGVSFRSIGVDDMPIFYRNTYYNPGTFAWTGHTTYGPGFNIVADFSSPVFDVSADVMTAAGYFVTMKAYDASGGLITSVTSGAAPSTFWAGTLSLTTGTPIARLEWWSSSQYSTVGIDNLSYGTVPDPASTLLLLGMSLTGLVAAKRRWR